jgi:hypothetical protein
MRQCQLRVRTMAIELRDPARIMVILCPINVSTNIKRELYISREEAESMLSLLSIKRLILNIKKAIEEVMYIRPRDNRLEDLNIRK